jgi:hypothetical protein
VHVFTAYVESDGIEPRKKPTHIVKLRVISNYGQTPPPFSSFTVDNSGYENFVAGSFDWSPYLMGARKGQLWFVSYDPMYSTSRFGNGACQIPSEQDPLVTAYVTYRKLQAMPNTSDFISACRAMVLKTDTVEVDRVVGFRALYRRSLDKNNNESDRKEYAKQVIDLAADLLKEQSLSLSFRGLLLGYCYPNMISGTSAPGPVTRLIEGYLQMLRTEPADRGLLAQLAEKLGELAVTEEEQDGKKIYHSYPEILDALTAREAQDNRPDEMRQNFAGNVLDNLRKQGKLRLDLDNKLDVIIHKLPK